MKKLIYLSFAFALVVGLTQCKKKIETIQSVPDGVYITLEVEGGDKAIVDPHGGSHCATVKFEDGDKIFVGNNGKNCGWLEYNGATNRFEGHYVRPTSADDTDYLHFYFTQGNDKVALVESLCGYIPDQAERYRVVSYGRSTSLYSSGITHYYATLQNYCAIVKFNITGVHPDTLVTITGMNNRVQIDYSKNIGPGDPVNPFVYSKMGDGDIRLHNEANGERWAILLPQDEVTDATAYAVGYHSTSAFTVPAVRANGYYDSGVSVDMGPNSPLNNGFSVNSWGKQVVFSPGNLQATYDGSSWSWHFAPNQWSYIGNAPGNTNIIAQAPWISAPGTVDIFRLSTTNTNYGLGFPPTYAEGYFVDWGTNAIGSDAAGTWRTPDMFEWHYLMGVDAYKSDLNHSLTNPYYYNNRIDKVALATVNGTPGLVLLPDTWTLPAGCTFTPAPLQSNNQYYYPKKDGYDSNIYDAAAWALMETNGAVFLPAAGANLDPDYVGEGDGKPTGFYQSSTIVMDVSNITDIVGHNARISSLGFSGPGFGGAGITCYLQNTWMSVRLIRYAW